MNAVPDVASELERLEHKLLDLQAVIKNTGYRYCMLDTWAMVRLLERLRELVGAEVAGDGLGRL